MNNKILAAIIIFDTFLTFILVTRFVSIDWPSAEAKPVACAPADSPICRNQARINETYLKNIKPVFQEKCFRCHGMGQDVPLYSILPPVSFLVKHDTHEAKEHMNISWDYPFIGHKDDTADETLKELKEVVEENKMPPFRYKIMHWRSGLTEEEKKTILQWVGESRQLLPKNESPQKTHHHDHHH